MTTFVKTKFKKSDDHTNVHKYRVAANITEYHIILKLIFLRILYTYDCFIEYDRYFLLFNKNTYSGSSKGVFILRNINRVYTVSSLQTKHPI